MIKTLRFTASVLALCATVAVSVPVMAQEAGTISRVQVEGTERIDPQTILSYMTVKPGEQYNQEALSESTKALYGTGLFADVSITPKNGVLVVSVVENPLINQVAFEGNEKLKDEELNSEIASRARNVLSRSTVQSDVERIRELYRRSGRFSVQVDPKVIRLDQNRVNLVFEINEGPVSEIRGIKFVGNEEFSDDALRGVIASKEERWYRFLSTTDRYDQDRLAYDQELLRRYYLKEGYVDFRVVSATAELTPDKEAFFITITLEEGKRYKIGKVDFDTAAIKDAETGNLKKKNEVDPGDWYDADALERSVDGMVDTLGNAQYNFFTVKPDIQRHSDTQTVDLTYRVVPTPKQYVERIDIKGNVRTQDKVIRREFDLAEGDAFNRQKVAKAEQNLKDLDFFDTVKVHPVQGSAPDQQVINVDVQEKSTGEISVGAGFSTSDGPLADFQVRERNFLGKGQDLSFATTLSGKRTEFDTSFTEPYFLDRDLSAGFDLFHTTRDLQDESSYDQKRTGGALRLGFPLGKDLRETLKYRIENNNIDNVQTDASRYIKDQEGSRVTSAISQQLTYDKRNSTLDPTDGWMGWFNTELAGLGGDAKYISGKIGATYYYPIAHNWVFNLLGEGGAIQGLAGEDVKINERYQLGSSTLRGFRYGGLGPRDTTTGDALGGNMFYRGTAELTFPTGLPEELGVSAHAFTDVGSLWNVDETGPGLVDENSLRAAAGLGISWKSPFGPIRMDISQPYLKKDYDEKENFKFSFGTRF